MNGIQPGETCVITHDIGTVFYQGEQVVVEQIDPDPQAPQYMYLVHSSQDLNWYKLSVADLAPVGPQEYAPPKMTRAQRKAASPQKKTGSKKLLVILLIVLLVGAAGFAAVYFLVLNKPEDNTINQNKPGPVRESGSTTPSSGTSVYGTATVTKAQFDQVQNGMSYAQVTGVFAGPGVVKAEAGSPGTPGYQISYAWDGEEAGWYIFCTFVDDKMSSKTSSGF